MKLHLLVEAVVFPGCKRTTVAVCKHAHQTINVPRDFIVRPQIVLLLDIALAVGAATALPPPAISNARANYNALSHAASLHPLIVGKVEAMARSAAQTLASHGTEAIL